GPATNFSFTPQRKGLHSIHDFRKRLSVLARITNIRSVIRIYLKNSDKNLTISSGGIGVYEYDRELYSNRRLYTKTEPVRRILKPPSDLVSSRQIATKDFEL